MDSGFKAKLEIDVASSDKVNRKTVTVKNKSDLFLLSGERDLYDGFIVEGIECASGRECIEFVNTEVIKLGKSIGSVDDDFMKRAQIRRTIETHFTKELMYFEKGIKVLSLFFIDEVKKYRSETGEEAFIQKCLKNAMQSLSLQF